MPKLAIDIEARFAQAMDAMDSLGRKADQQARFMKTAFVGVGTVLGAAFGAFSLSALTNLADSVAAFKGLSEQMGDTASAVASLRSASDISGVSLDTVAKASVRLTSTLAKGGQEARDTATALGAMGIAFADFKRLSPTDQLEQVALQLAKFEDGAGKTAVAVQLFGRAGADLIPFFNDLAAAGGKVADLTDEQIASADEYTKSVARMQSELRKLAQSIATDVLPTFNTLITKYNELREKSVGVIGAIVGSVLPGLALSNIKESVNVLLAEQKRLTDGLENPPIIFGNSKKYVEQTRKRLDEITVELTEFRRKRDLLIGPTGTETDKVILDAPKRGKLNFSIPDKPKSTATKTPRETEAERLQKWLDQQVQSAEKYNLLETTAIKIAEGKLKAESGITPEIEKQLLAIARMSVESEKMKKLTEERAGFEDFMAQLLDTQDIKTRALADSYRALIDPAAQYRDQLREIAELESGGDLSNIEATRAKDAIFDKMAGLDEQKEKVKELDEFTRSAAQNMQSAFADFLFDPFKDGIDGMLKGFANTVRKMVAEAAAAQLMKTLLGDYGKTGVAGGLLGALMTGMGGSGSSTNTTGTTLRAIEGGGNDVYGSAMKSSTSPIVQNITFNGATSTGFDERRAARLIGDVAMAKVAETQSRGG